MSYEESKAQAEAFSDSVLGGMANLKAAIEVNFWRRYMHGKPGLNVGKPCSVSYGWCFTHMDKAQFPLLPSAAVGPFCIEQEFNAHPGPEWGSSP